MSRRFTKSFSRLRSALPLALAVSLAGTAAHGQSLTNGNLVVLQVGTGSASLSNAGTALSLKEYTPTGLAQAAPVTTIAVPTTGSGQRLVLSGTATSEGFLALSADSSLLSFGGYDTTTGFASVASSPTSAVLRVVDTVGASGGVGRADTTSAFSGNNIRSVVRGTAEDYWAGGGNGGVQYLGNTAAAIALGTANTNIRVVQILNGNLYYTTSATAGYGLYKITGLPTAAPATATQIIATGTSGSTTSPYGFAINATETVVYIADDRTIASGGGIQKWVNNGGTWSLADTLNAGAGTRGLTVDWSGTYPVLYATTATTSGNNLVRVVDSGFAAGYTNSFEVLATAPANTVFRGVAFAPRTVLCTPPALSATTTAVTCSSNGTVTLTATGGSAITGYSWTGPSGFTATTQNLSNVAAGIYTVTVTATGGCTATVAATVANNANLTATATASGATSFCQGGNVVLQANTGTGYTYQWYNGTTIINGATSASYTATASGNYRVAVTNGNCNDTSALVAVTVYAPPVATITPAGSQTLCAGNTLVITANSGTGYTYQWLNGTTVISGATNASYTASVSGNYRVRVTNNNGCFDTSSALAVTVNARPVAAITPAGSQTLCAGDTVVLSATSGTGYTYQWLNAGAAISGATQSSFAATASGNYRVRVTNSNGCSDTAMAVSVVVNPLPTPVVSYNNGVLSVAGTYSSYQWYLNGALLPGANAATLVPLANGNYTVRVDANGCTGGSNTVAVSGIGVDAVALTRFQVFPNPTADQVVIHPAGRYALAVLDEQGRVVLEAREVSEINLRSLTDGVYLLRITAAGDPAPAVLRIHKQSR